MNFSNNCIIHRQEATSFNARTTEYRLDLLTSIVICGSRLFVFDPERRQGLGCILFLFPDFCSHLDTPLLLR